MPVFTSLLERFKENLTIIRRSKMSDLEFDQLFILLCIVVIPTAIVNFMLGPVLTSLIIVGAIGFFVYARMRVRLAEIEAELKAAELEAERNRNSGTINPGATNPRTTNPGTTNPASRNPGPRSIGPGH